jgi:alpha-L-rhamnosidase
MFAMPRNFIAVACLALTVAALRAATVPPSAVSVENLRCEYWAAPLGIDLPNPHLSWNLESDKRGEVQAAYQILASTTAALLAQDKGDLWDSGQIKSDQTLDVLYAGKPLATDQEIFWKVRVWDQDGKASAWSAPAKWTMGVMGDADWHAKWIGASVDLKAATYMLARSFDVKPGLKRAVVNVCGLGQYEMTLNGKKVGDDLLTPGWSKYDKTDLYDTYDITALLRPGANAAGLMLGNGMYNNGADVIGARYSKFTGSFGPPKAIAQLHLEYENGQVETIGTDAQWRIAAGPITFSSEYGGEDYDARLEPADWNQPGFDYSPWKAAAEVDGPGGKLRGLSDAAFSIGTHDVFKPIKATELQPGQTVYDLGQNAAMMPRLTVHGPAGATVRIIPAELLERNGMVDRSSTGNKIAYWQYTLRGDAAGEIWFPKFFYHGCRYFQVELTTPDGDVLPTIDSIEGIVVHSNSDPVGEFTCSNDLFNRMETLIRWAQRSNMMSILTDCPHRERLGWLEQDYLNGPSLRYEFDVSSLMNKALNDMTDSQLDSGLVPSIAPEYTKFTDRNAPTGSRNAFGDSPEWGSAIIQCAWQQYQWDGDIELLRRYYEPMKNYAAYLSSRAQNGIINYGLGDWFDIGPGKPGQAQLTPKSLTATAIFYDDLNVMAQTAQLLGKNDDAANFVKEAAATRATYQQTFYHADTGQFSTGSQTANAMSVALGLANPEQISPAVAGIVQDIQSRGNSLTSGDVGYRYLLRALAQGGRSDVIFTMNNQSDRPGYGYQLAHGATSLTESWDARGGSSGSQDHFMLGHIMEWFYHDLAGIQIDPSAVGYKKIIIAPTPTGDIQWAKASLDSVHGRIESEWHRDGNSFTLRVKIPANTTATIHLPASDTASIMESGLPLAKREGVHLLPASGKDALFSVDSGTYNFSCTLSSVKN